MSLVRPYPLALFNDILPVRSAVFDVQRYDEQSSDGHGNHWQAEMADPKWFVDITVDIEGLTEARSIAALLRQLHGAQFDFLITDPAFPYPAADPTGIVLGASVVQVHTVGGSNMALRLKGLPAGYQLLRGDKGQIDFGDPLRTFFFEVSEDVAAAGTGITPEFDIFPHIAPGVEADMTVTLAKPACRMFLPEGYSAGEMARTIATGMAFRALQRL